MAPIDFHSVFFAVTPWSSIRHRLQANNQPGLPLIEHSIAFRAYSWICPALQQILDNINVTTQYGLHERCSSFQSSVSGVNLETFALQQGTRLAPPEALAQTPHIRALKEGTRVTVVGIQEGGGMLRNDMKGRVVCMVAPEKYMVSFSNLVNAQEIDASKLRRAEKFRRDHHICMCGEVAVSVCSRCRLTWYCSRDCQVADYQRHKCMCKHLASGDPIMKSLMKAARKTSLENDGSVRTVVEE